MTKSTLITLLGLAASMAFSSLLLATPSAETASSTKDTELHTRLEAEYKQALDSADESRAVAAASVEKAREQLHLAAEQQYRDRPAGDNESSSEQHAEIAKMREELDYAHRQLLESSREIARAKRELARVKIAGEAPNYVFSSKERPVLGVILGDRTDVGIRVLGVSPDGPAERAGVKAGDIVVALGGRVLAAVDDTGNARNGLKVALQDIKAGEPVVVSVERGSDTLDLTVVPELREPLTWQSVIRFPAAPTAPGADGNTITIERTIVPEIDTEALAEQIKNMRIEIEERRALMESETDAPRADVNRYEFRFEDGSGMGSFALHDAYAWFGMPLASGLQLAAIEPGLGAYFKTDRGVLVLKAKEANDLLLKAGDVILSVRGTEVNSPADFMRALREFEPGDELEMDIKRKRRNKTLTPVIDAAQVRFFAPRPEGLHEITVTTDSD